MFKDKPARKLECKNNQVIGDLHHYGLIANN